MIFKCMYGQLEVLSGPWHFIDFTAVIWYFIDVSYTYPDRR